MADTSKLAALRDMLWRMEVEVGLEALTRQQKDVYYAACLAADGQKIVQSDDIREHPMLSPITRPTFYRALKELVEQGFLVSASSRRDGQYKIVR